MDDIENGLFTKNLSSRELIYQLLAYQRMYIKHYNVPLGYAIILSHMVVPTPEGKCALRRGVNGRKILK
jgi:hypothetical protein